MATTAFTIYSHYDPSERNEVENEPAETVELDETPPIDDLWDAEAFKARTRPAPPRFVKATMDEWSSTLASGSIADIQSKDENDVSSWYRSLTQTPSSSSTKLKAATTVPRVSASSPSTQLSAERPKKQKNAESNWFIQKVLQSQPPPIAQDSSSSLAEILARDPPPLPASGDKFRPPVFLALGPSNKGYALLEDNGWTEGEALGLDVMRARRAGKGKARRSVKSHTTKWETDSERSVIVESEVGDGEVKEMKRVSVIDLTMSDDDDDEEDHMEDDPSMPFEEKNREDLKSEDVGDEFVPSTSTSASDSKRLALITPLPTILKADRLGIGLKAKTVGPYKASMKRITHGEAALSAHLQRAEEARKRRQKHGRGHRSFARQYKEELRWRADMQAYMNS